jgi:predicted dehydrogenase
LGKARLKLSALGAVLVRSPAGVLGTIELGNTVPYDGSDGEFKIAGRDAILVLYHDDTLRVIIAAREETTAAAPAEPSYPTAVRDILDCWRRGAPPPASVHDCLRVVRLIDEAYALAGRTRA